MKKRLYISNDEAGFFDNNKMLCLDNPPTQGDFIVGDIVISSKQQNGIFGWVCVLAGSPGRWEVICDLKVIQNAIENLEQRQETIVNSDINTIKNQINQLVNQALTIDKEHKDELNKLNVTVNENMNNILNINKELTNIKQTAGNLQGSIDQVVTGINAQVQTNAKNIQINSDRIAVLEGQHKTMSEEIETINNDIKGLQQTAGSLQEVVDDAMAGFSAQIQENADRIENLENDVKGLQESVGSLDEIVGDATAGFSVQIQENTNRIENLEKVTEDINVKVGSIESAVEDNNLEIEDIKKGLVGALVAHGVNANVGMTWKELFELVLGNASGEPGGGVNPMPGELILYKNGVVNDNTEFKEMLIDPKYYLSDYIDLDIGQDGALLWFGFNGKVDFSRYESAIIEIKNVAEHASSIGISRNDVTGYGYEHGISNFNKEFMKGKEEVVIEEGSKVVHTISFADLYTDEDKEGYFGIYVTRVAGTGGAVNDEILINSITVIPKPLVPCTGLSLNKSELSLNVGGNPFTLIATVLPADCTDEVVWRSTNNAVATVDQNGVVTPKAVGSCNIRVTCGELTMNCAVTVNAAVGSCTGITLKQHPITLELGHTIKTSAVYEILPAGCTDEIHLEFTSVISVTNGVIKGEQVGSTTLTIRCGNHTASLIVNVVEIEREIPCTGIEFTQATGFKITGSETLNLNNYLVVRPEGCTDKVVWATDSNAVAVTDGIVTVLAGGSAKVQARCGGYAATANVEAVVGGNGNGIVLFDNGFVNEDTDFKNIVLTEASGVNQPYGMLPNGTIGYQLAGSHDAAWFTFDGYVNFNNYTRIEITAYTENSQQVPTLEVFRTILPGEYGYGANVSSAGVVELDTQTMDYNKTSHTYSFDVAKLRQNAESQMGYLGIAVARRLADGYVYISKIVVYREGDEQPGQDSGTPEPEVVHCTGISVSPTSKTINVGDFIAFGSEVRVSVSPSNCTDSISYRSGNEDILSPSIAAAGVFQGYSAGTTTMIATCGGKSASCTVTVR